VTNFVYPREAALTKFFNDLIVFGKLRVGVPRDKIPSHIHHRRLFLAKRL
jgi:hypothetical protein